jgi:hypothetical protein
MRCVVSQHIGHKKVLLNGQEFSNNSKATSGLTGRNALPYNLLLMKTKRLFACIYLLPSLIVGALASSTVVVPAQTEQRLVRSSSFAAPVNSPEKGGCPVWEGRRLRSTNSGVLSVRYSIGLGRVSNNGNTGRISLREQVITHNSYTPDVLALSVSEKGNNFELIRDPSRPQRVIADPGEKGGYTSQSIKQIRAPETFVDIVVLSEWEYEIRFYHPDQVRAKRNGFYGVSGEPFSVSRIRNPNPPNTDSLEITRINDGTTEKSEYKYDERSDTWSFFRDGVETVRKLSEVNATNPCERIETRFDLKKGSWVKTIKIFKAFPWGQDIIKKIEDADGEAKTTTYKYFEDPDGPHYTFLKTTIHPDGTIERHNRHPDPFKKAP